MCAVSMIGDHYNDKWYDYRKWVNEQSTTPPVNVTITSPTIEEIREEIRKIVQEEMKEFKKLIERARKYDEENNEPDCETEEKFKLIKDLANKLGIEIDFV